MTNDRIAGRSIRALCFSGNVLLLERTLPSGSDLILGHGPNATLRMPGWAAADITIISAGRLLWLGPHMRVTMCHDAGEDWLQGSYEELCAGGLLFPLEIRVSKINLKVSPGTGVIIEFKKHP